MSEGSDFDRFLEAVRADHVASSANDDDARRVEASLASRLPLRRPLPPIVATALATTQSSAAAGPSGGASPASTTSRELAKRSWWTKSLAVLVPVIGLPLATYSLTTAFAGSDQAPAPPSAPIPPSALVVERAPGAVSDPVPSSALTNTAPPATLTGPGELPDATLGRAARPSPAHGRRAGTLDAELALLGEVNAALQAHRAARALALIDEHDRRFASGVLAPEFAGQRAVTLAALGRHAEACAQSKKFLAKYPNSPLVPQVRSSCVDPTSSR